MSVMRSRFSVFTICLLLVACDDTRQSTQEAVTTQAAVSVRVTPVVHDEAPDALRFAGVAVAGQRANLAFQVGGVINRDDLRVGQQVSAGDELAQVFNPELQPALASAQARLIELRSQYEQAQREADRGIQLFERGVISTQQREQLSANAASLAAALQNAEAGLRQRQQLVAEARLRAPFSGHIEALPVESGEFVAPGQVVVRLAGGSELEVTVQVPAEWASGLTVGQPIRVWARQAPDALVAEISEMGRGGLQGNVLYPVTLRLPAEGVRSGDTLEVELPRPSIGQVRVPLAAVVRTDDGAAVFRVREGRAERVPVTVAALRGEWAVLADSSLVAEDAVIFAGLSWVLDGDAVELLP